MATGPPAERAAVIGTGLIGGSIGLALRERGWHVTGSDHDRRAAERALELGAIDAVGLDADADITFIAAPVRLDRRRGQAGPRRDEGRRSPTSGR